MSEGAKNEIRRGATKHLIRVLLQRIVGIALFFIAAGTFYNFSGICRR